MGTFGDSSLNASQSGPRYISHPDVIGQPMGDQTALLHMGTNHFYELNATASRLWELVCSGRDRRQAIEQLLQEFEVDAVLLADEVDETIRVLKERGLLIEQSEG